MKERKNDLLRIGLLCGRGVEAKVSYSLATVLWNAACIAFQNLRCCVRLTNLRASNSFREYLLFPFLSVDFNLGLSSIFLRPWPMLLLLFLGPPLLLEEGCCLGPPFLTTESSSAVSSMTSIPNAKEAGSAVTVLTPASLGANADSSSSSNRFFFISSSADSRTGCSWESEASPIAIQIFHCAFSFAHTKLGRKPLHTSTYSHLLNTFFFFFLSEANGTAQSISLPKILF